MERKYIKFIPVVKKNLSITTGKGHYDDKGTHADVKMFVKVESNIPDSEFKERGWTWSHDGLGIKFGTAVDVNRPFYSVSNKFENPYDVFSVKGEFSTGSTLFLSATRDNIVGHYEISRDSIKLLSEDRSLSEKFSLKVYVDEDEVPEPEPEPEKPKKKLLVTFIKGNWFVAALQSLIFWKKITRVWTHVQVGLDDSEDDLSAEPKCMTFVDRSESIREARQSVTFAIELTDNEAYVVEEKLRLDEGKRYDFFLYFRWFLNVSIFYVLLGVIPMLMWGSIVPYLIVTGILYIPVNGVSWMLSRNRYGCSKHASELLDTIGIDFGYNKKFHTSSPTDMLEKIIFMQQNLKIDKVLVQVK